MSPVTIKLNRAPCLLAASQSARRRLPDRELSSEKQFSGGDTEDARRLLGATGADLGGVEYLINAETGEPTFYDINALSNFVADAQTVIGFDPFVDLVDFIEERMTR